VTRKRWMRPGVLWANWRKGVTSSYQGSGTWCRDIHVFHSVSHPPIHLTHSRCIWTSEISKLILIWIEVWNKPSIYLYLMFTLSGYTVGCITTSHCWWLCGAVLDISLLKCQEREVTQFKAQPTQGSLDGSVSTQAQEGNAGGSPEETHSTHRQVPARYHRRYAQRHSR